jgi:hypothetical protein
MILDVLTEALELAVTAGLDGGFVLTRTTDGNLWLYSLGDCETERKGRQLCRLPKAVTREGLTSHAWSRIQAILLAAGADAKGRYEVGLSGRGVQMVLAARRDKC